MVGVHSNVVKWYHRGIVLCAGSARSLLTAAVAHDPPCVHAGTVTGVAAGEFVRIQTPALVIVAGVFAGGGALSSPSSRESGLNMMGHPQALQPAYTSLSTSGRVLGVTTGQKSVDTDVIVLVVAVGLQPTTGLQVDEVQDVVG